MSSGNSISNSSIIVWTTREGLSENDPLFCIHLDTTSKKLSEMAWATFSDQKFCKVVWRNIDGYTPQKIALECQNKEYRKENYWERIEVLPNKEYKIHIFRLGHRGLTSLDPGFFEAVATTQELARFLTYRSNDVEANKCAKEIINKFYFTPYPDRGDVSEILSLFELQPTESRRGIIDHLTLKIKGGVVDNDSLIEGFTRVFKALQKRYYAELIKIYNEDPKKFDIPLPLPSYIAETLNSNDLETINNVLVQWLKGKHLQPNDLKTVEKKLKALVVVFEMMVITGVKELQRKEKYEPIFDVIERFKDHSNLDIAFLSAEALQSLVNVGNDEKNSFWRRLSHIIKGLSFLASMLSPSGPVPIPSLNAIPIWEAVKEFKKAFSYLAEKEKWFIDLTVLNSLITKSRGKYLANFKQQILGRKKEAEEQAEMTWGHPFFLKGLVESLKNVIRENPRSSSELLIALEILLQVSHDNLTGNKGLFTLTTENLLWRGQFKAWRNHDLIPGWRKQLLEDIFWTFYECTFHSNEEIRRKSLEKIAQGLLMRELLGLNKSDKLEPISGRDKVEEAEIQPGGLFNQAIQDHFAWHKGLNNWFRDFVKDHDLQRDLEYFIPLSAREGLEVVSTPLFDKIEEFLDNPKQKVLLLLGGPGAGKSFSIKKFVMSAWQTKRGDRFKYLGYVPVFISLDQLASEDYRSVIQESLKNYIGLTALPNIHDRKFLFIFDSYDEFPHPRDLDGKLLRLFNVYEDNKLFQWENSKVIISCRNGEHTFLKTHFMPRNGGMKELTIIGLNAKDKENYFTQYTKARREHPELKLSPKWFDSGTYQKVLRELGEINIITETPFFLSVFTFVLPFIFEGKKQSYEKTIADLKSYKENDYLKILTCINIERQYKKPEYDNNKIKKMELLYAILASTIVMRDFNLLNKIKFPWADNTTSEKLKKVLATEQVLWTGFEVNDSNLLKLLKGGLFKLDERTQTMSFVHEIIFEYVNGLRAWFSVLKEIESHLDNETFDPDRVFGGSREYFSVSEENEELKDNEDIPISSSITSSSPSSSSHFTSVTNLKMDFKEENK